MIQNISHHIERSLNISVDVSEPNNDHEMMFEKILEEHVSVMDKNFSACMNDA